MRYCSLHFTVAFSVVPLTLYIPPVRSLNLFVETIEDLLRESRVYTTRLYPRARHVRLEEDVVHGQLIIMSYQGIYLANNRILYTKPKL
ncbi:hypothetical protein SADUNF_Sadunf05G0108500 [Salix dunnii]|uniref:Uncharacterized protein n=1 Tax=Salix dunnii TaxID=1413687 RepID=A0A835K4N4_9ROSI|nr:hypothetical protein SADUNF_Sadunf05G0108500 [Salix dunnii]